MSAAYTDIMRVLASYFDMLYFCDTHRLRQVFHPRAIYATADANPLLYRTMDEYSAVIEARESPASRREARQDYIDAIELAGENMAFSRVRCSIGSRDFVDFLTLVRTDAGWQIIAKIFQIIEQPA